MTRPLTPRQEQTLHMLNAGYTTHGIADRLTISPETVRYHIKSAYRNLGVHTRRDAFAKLELSKTCCHVCGQPLQDQGVA